MSRSYTSLHLTRAVPADIPELTALTTAAFSTDSHTILKDYLRGRRPMGNIHMDVSRLESYMAPEMSDRVEVMCIREGLDGDEDKGRILGYCVWCRWNWDGSKSNPDNLPDPRLESEFYNPPPLPSSASPLQKLEDVTSRHLARFILSANPWGAKRPNFYIESISVHPSAQGQGIGKMLLQYGKDLADQNDSHAWVHASMGGYPMFEACGFKAADELSLDLDQYAGGVKWTKKVLMEGEEKEVEVDWGTYTFKYCVYGKNWPGKYLE